MSPEAPRVGPASGLVRNAVSNWIAFAVEAASALVLTPALIHGLGDFYFGMYSIAAALIEYYGLLDIGLRNTLKRFVAKYEGAGDRRALDEVFNSAMAFGAAAFFALCGLTAIAAVYLPGWMRIAEQGRPVFTAVVALLGFSMAVTFNARLLGSYLLGFQRFDLYNAVTIGNAVLRTAAVLVLMRHGFGVVPVALVTLALAGLMVVSYAVLARKADPGLSVGLRHATGARIRELTAFSFYVFLSNVGDVFRFQLGPLVIGRMLSLAHVTSYSVATRFIRLFRGVLIGLLSPLTPAYSRLAGSEREDELRLLFFRSLRVSAVFSFTLGGLLVLNGAAILRFWVGEKYVSSYPVLAVLGLAYALEYAQTPGMTLIYARGTPQWIGFLNLLEGAANLALSIAWAPRYGILGVALATALPLAVNKIVFQSWCIVSQGRIALREYLGALGRPVLACAAGLGVCWTVGVPALRVTLPAFACVLAAQTALFALLAFFVGLSGPERRQVRQWSRGRVANWWRNRAAVFGAAANR